MTCRPTRHTSQGFPAPPAWRAYPLPLSALRFLRHPRSTCNVSFPRRPPVCECQWHSYGAVALLLYFRYLLPEPALFLRCQQTPKPVPFSLFPLKHLLSGCRNFPDLVLFLPAQFLYSLWHLPYLFYHKYHAPFRHFPSVPAIPAVFPLNHHKRQDDYLFFSAAQNAQHPALPSGLPRLEWHNRQAVPVYPAFPFLLFLPVHHQSLFPCNQKGKPAWKQLPFLCRMNLSHPVLYLILPVFLMKLVDEVVTDNLLRLHHSLFSYAEHFHCGFRILRPVALQIFFHEAV